MLTRFQLVGIALACGFVWAVIAQRSSPPPGPTAAAAPSSPSSPPPVDRAALLAAHDRETQCRVQELTRLQTAKAARELAADKMKSSRQFLQLTHRFQWSVVLTSNWPAYLKLRQQAANSPTRSVSCTLCDGTGAEPFCILCSDHKGRCVTCRGSGRVGLAEVCPTCLGNGQCYLCFGSGSMLCPFCYSGTIETRRPLPPNAMPIE